MNLYLAAILGLGALTNSPTAVFASPARLLALIQESQTQPDTPGSSASQESAQSSQSPQAPEPAAAQPVQSGQPDTSPKKPSADQTATKKRRRKKHIVAASTATPGKKVVKNGGTADPAVQLSPGVSDEQASRQRQSTTQLLAATDGNLKQLAARQLSATQQDSVSQIRKYMEQAKEAEVAGDVQRAQNLASKALMLSDDLVKH